MSDELRDIEDIEESELVEDPIEEAAKKKKKEKKSGLLDMEIMKLGNFSFTLMHSLGLLLLLVGGYMFMDDEPAEKKQNDLVVKNNIKKSGDAYSNNKNQTPQPKTSGSAIAKKEPKTPEQIKKEKIFASVQKMQKEREQSKKNPVKYEKRNSDIDFFNIEKNKKNATDVNSTKSAYKKKLELKRKQEALKRKQEAYAEKMKKLKVESEVLDKKDAYEVVSKNNKPMRCFSKKSLKMYMVQNANGKIVAYKKKKAGKVFDGSLLIAKNKTGKTVYFVNIGNNSAIKIVDNKVFCDMDRRGN